MSFETAFLVYAASVRLGLVGAGVVAIVLGYRLFVIGGTGRMPRSGSPIADPQPATEVTGSGGGFQLSVRNAAPGTCFALFGAATLIAAILQGFPSAEFTTEGGKKVIVRGVSNEPPAANGTQSPTQKTDDVVLSTFEAKMAEADRLLRGARPTDALRAYEEALATPGITAKDAARPLNQVAWLHQKDGRTAEAAALIGVALKLDPDNAEYLDTSAVIALDGKDPAAAVAAARRAVAIRPNSARFERTLALSLEAAGQWDDARMHMEHAVQLDDKLSGDLDDLKRRLRNR